MFWIDAVNVLTNTDVVLCVGYGSGTSAKSYRRDSEGKDTRGGGKRQANDEQQLFRLLPLGVTGAYPSNYGL